MSKRKERPPSLSRPLRRLTREDLERWGISGWAEHCGRTLREKAETAPMQRQHVLFQGNSIRIGNSTLWLKCLNFISRGHILKCHFYGKVEGQTLNLYWSKGKGAGSPWTGQLPCVRHSLVWGHTAEQPQPLALGTCWGKETEGLGTSPPTWAGAADLFHMGNCSSWRIEDQENYMDIKIQRLQGLSSRLPIVIREKGTEEPVQLRCTHA